MLSPNTGKGILIEPHQLKELVKVQDSKHSNWYLASAEQSSSLLHLGVPHDSRLVAEHQVA